MSTPQPTDPDPIQLPPRRLNDHAWQDLAACPPVVRATGDIDLFFAPPEDIDRIALAKQTCSRCPVTAECLDAALDRGDAHGIYGGYTAHERRSQRRTRQARTNQEHVDAALRRQQVHLTVSEKEALTMRAVIEGMSAQELAKVCGWTVKHAKRQIAEARAAYEENQRWVASLKSAREEAA